MGDEAVVLGAGYGGAGAIKRLESRLAEDVELTWVSDRDYHLVLHEVHRCISEPAIKEKITVPVRDIKRPATTFIEGDVVGIDTDERRVELAGAESVGYDYLLVALGTRTAFFGIRGLREYANTLKGIDDALGINDALQDAAAGSTAAEPAQVVVGGAGLSGIQTAGEIAEFRDVHDAALGITLIEGLERVLPMGPAPLQDALRRRLDARGVDVITGEFVGAVDDTSVYFGDAGEIEYDVLVWTGGITGREAVRNATVDRDERSHRITAEGTFRTSDDRVFAIGDCALIADASDGPAPPTARAAWQAAGVAGENVARAMIGEPLQQWSFTDMGTVVSVGQDAVAHGVSYKGIPFPKTTFGGVTARTLKKAIAAKWLRRIAGTGYAVRAWPDM
jgi:NADH dehydrogenase